MNQLNIPIIQELAVTVKEGRAKGDWVLNWAYLTIKYKDGRGPVNLWVNVVYVNRERENCNEQNFL